VGGEAKLNQGTLVEGGGSGNWQRPAVFYSMSPVLFSIVRVTKVKAGLLKQKVRRGQKQCPLMLQLQS